MTNEQKIQLYVKYMVDHPYDDAYVASEKFLTSFPTTNKRVKLVITDLLKLSPSKRMLVTDIVKSKTNYEIATSNDSFKNFMMIKNIGETFTEIGPAIIKEIKWLMR